MRKKNYRVWIEKIDEDGDYGHVLYCGACDHKIYKCQCHSTAIIMEAIK